MTGRYEYDVVTMKSVNEVKYWLKENGKKMDEDDIMEVAEEALSLFVDADYSSLEAAVEDILSNRDFDDDNEEE